MMAQPPLTPYEATPNANHPQVIRLAGWSLYNSSGTVDTHIRLRHGSEEGEVLAEFVIAAKTSVTSDLAPRGINAPDGVYIQKVGSGACSGVLYRG
jgi:hypothetical protein